MATDEISKILDMVAVGTISATEGDRLLNALSARPGTMKCPFCAEEVPANATACPHCRSPFGPDARTAVSGPGGAGAPAGRARSFHTAGRLSKVLIIYMVFVCIVVLLCSWDLFWSPPAEWTQAGLAIIGLVAAVLMWKGRTAGWGPGLLWSLAQVVVIVVGNAPLNQQGFHLGITTTTNGLGVGFNWVGMVLAIGFFFVRNEWIGDGQ
jgi:hypothetical protein